MRRAWWLVALLLPVSAWAASVSGVSGTISDGQSIVVSGTGFGSTGPTVVLFDDFDNPSNTAGDYLRFSRPKIGAWHFQKNAPTYTTAYARSGSKSLLVSQYTPRDYGGLACGVAVPTIWSDGSGGEVEGACEVMAHCNGGANIGHNCTGDGDCPGSTCATTTTGSHYQTMGVDFATLVAGGETPEVYWEYSYYVPSGNYWPGGDHNFKASWIYGHDGDHSYTSGNDWRTYAGNAVPDYANGSLEVAFGSNDAALLSDTSCNGSHSIYSTYFLSTIPVGSRWNRVMSYVRGSRTCTGELWMAQAPFSASTLSGWGCSSGSTCVGGANNGLACTGGDQCSGGYCAYADYHTCQMVRHQRTGHVTLSSGGDSGYGRISINGYARDQADGTENYRWYYDDVYIAIGTGARARVEIANAQTWGSTASASTLDMTICTPTSWASDGSSVTCTVRSGSFANGASAYLFVIDANGNVSDQDGNSGNGSQGYAITFDVSAPTSLRGATVSGGAVR